MNNKMAAESLRRKIGIALAPARKKRFDALMKKVRSAAGKSVAALATPKGCEMSLEQAIELAAGYESNTGSLLFPVNSAENEIKGPIFGQPQPFNFHLNFVNWILLVFRSSLNTSAL